MGRRRRVASPLRGRRPCCLRRPAACRLCGKRPPGVSRRAAWVAAKEKGPSDRI